MLWELVSESTNRSDLLGSRTYVRWCKGEEDRKEDENHETPITHCVT